jgi:four helix bundle protein
MQYIPFTRKLGKKNRILYSRANFKSSQKSGFRKLKSFQIAQLSYDVTVRFCDKYVEKRSQTHDPMVQAARSGVQNIAEGSLASATSKKTELRLTNVAKASLGELKLDFEDFLRHRNLALWDKDDPLRAELIARRCKTTDEVAEWVREAHERCKENRLNGRHGQNGQENCTDLAVPL